MEENARTFRYRVGTVRVQKTRESKLTEGNAWLAATASIGQDTLPLWNESPRTWWISAFEKDAFGRRVAIAKASKTRAIKFNDRWLFLLSIYTVYCFLYYLFKSYELLEWSKIERGKKMTIGNKVRDGRISVADSYEGNNLEYLV